MFTYLVALLFIIGLPVTGFAQLPHDYVKVRKGASLCSNISMEQAKGALDPGKVSWRVTSNVRANGTQTVTAYMNETVYDRQSGETTTNEIRYDEDYAVFFKKDPDHKGMLLMISPRDGRIEASVELCQKSSK